MRIQGYIQPKPQKKPVDLIESVAGVGQLYEELKALQNDLIDAVNFKIEEIEDKYKEHEKGITDATQVLEEAKTEIISYLKNLKSGPPGKDADEEAIVQRVLAKIPVRDEQKLTSKVFDQVLSSIPSIEHIASRAAAQIPQPDEDVIAKKVLSKIPKAKGSLKIIQEKFDADPMSVIEKIMSLPEDSFKLKMGHVEGLDQTLSSFRSQLGRGYLHGGGDTVEAGTNITIVKNSAGKSVISSTGGSATTQAKELFDTSSATTTLTLAHTPASGTVVQLSYNGELIYENQAWTRSGVTITLLFTPEDGTHCEAIYSY